MKSPSWVIPMHEKGRGRVVPDTNQGNPDDKILAQQMEIKNQSKKTRGILPATPKNV